MNRSKDDHPGSNPEDAKISDGDFGAKATDRVEREYVSQEIRSEDIGHETARAGTQGRQAGVGGNDSGPGSSSGGEFDPQIDGGVARQVGHAAESQPTEKVPPAEETPVINRNPQAAPSSTSAGDITNETQHDNNAFKGDLTDDEAAGNSSR